MVGIQVLTVWGLLGLCSGICRRRLPPGLSWLLSASSQKVSSVLLRAVCDFDLCCPPIPWTNAAASVSKGSVVQFPFQGRVDRRGQARGE